MERSMLNITYKDRRTNIWVRERTKTHRYNVHCAKHKMVLGRAYQPPQRQPMDLACHHLETIWQEKTTRETSQAMERRPGQILERHDMAKDSTRQSNLETACWGLCPTTGHNGCVMMMDDGKRYTFLMPHSINRLFGRRFHGNVLLCLLTHCCSYLHSVEFVSDLHFTSLCFITDKTDLMFARIPVVSFSQAWLFVNLFFCGWHNTLIYLSYFHNYWGSAEQCSLLWYIWCWWCVILFSSESDCQCCIQSNAMQDKQMHFIC